MANKRKDSSVNVPLVVILLIIVCGIAFVISYSHREGKRDTGSLPAPNVKPEITPDNDDMTELPKIVSDPGPAPVPEKAQKDGGKTTKDAGVKAAKETGPASSAKEASGHGKARSSSDPKAMSREDMAELLNKFDRKHNENAAAEAAAAEPQAPAVEPQEEPSGEAEQ